MDATRTGGERTARPRRVGVVLLNLGGPDRPENVRPFLLELFRDPEVLKLPGGAPVRRALGWLIATLRAPGVARNYASVGGSPLLPRTRAQERALEARLDELAAPAGTRFVVRTAMRYWHPRADAALAELAQATVDELIALPLYPHACRATTGSSFAELQQVAAARGGALPLACIGSYATDPGYVAALARCVDEALAAARARDPAREPFLLFSAHGLPERIVQAGDPYVREIEATRAAVLAALRFRGEQALSFQSRAGPVRWIGPATADVLPRLGARGVKSLVIVPVSFVSDHIETVHEIDVELAHAARAAGIATFVRAPALDVRPDFVDALAALVLRAARVPREDPVHAGSLDPDAPSA